MNFLRMKAANRGHKLTLSDLTRYVAKRCDCHFLRKQLVSVFTRFIFRVDAIDDCLELDITESRPFIYIEEDLGKPIAILWLNLV